MKISTWIHPDPLEVEVEVSVEDITRALAETPDTPGAAFMMINRAAASMKATTDEIIAQMKPAQREVIAGFLTEQAARFNCQQPTP
jgi:hypothetical protein